jgi:hypothetical protein
MSREPYQGLEVFATMSRTLPHHMIHLVSVVHLNALALVMSSIRPCSTFAQLRLSKA